MPREIRMAKHFSWLSLVCTGILGLKSFYAKARHQIDTMKKVEETVAEIAI